MTALVVVVTWVSVFSIVRTLGWRWIEMATE